MSCNMYIIRFSVGEQGMLFRGVAEGKQVMECTLEEGILTFSLLFDFADKPPLKLRTAAAAGDEAEIRVLPYRMELYVNGVLQDEEWPCGDHSLDRLQLEPGEKAKIFCREYEEPWEPDVLYEFRNAEGWRPEENVFVGDCMPYSKDGIYHVLYLKDRHHHQSKWGKGAHQWSHISTEDFENWKAHPMAVAVDESWEGSICTGSWMEHEGKQYLFYTVRTCDGSPAPIRRSVSEDGYHYRKDREFCFTLSQKYTGESARDPKVVRAADGVFHMFLTTSLTGGCGCLAHLVSRDLDTWEELPEPIYIAGPDDWEPECSDYFYQNGFYYLVFSLRGKGHYLYSREPFTGWQEPADPVIPCKTVPKAAIWNDRLIFAGFDVIEGYAGNLTFTEAISQPNGELAFMKK